MNEALDLFHELVGRPGQEIAWWQMCARAVVIMAFGVVLVRIAGKRVFGKWGAIDILVSIIIGSNLSRALTGDAPLLATLAATTLLVILHAALAGLAARVHWIGPLVKGRPERIVLAGEPDHKAMRRHGVGPHDLEEALREGGVLRCEDVAEAWVERNGEISVIRRAGAG